MVSHAAGFQFLWSLGWHGKPKDGPVVVRVHGHLSAMRFGNLRGYEKPKTESFVLLARLSHVKRFKNRFQLIGWYRFARVRDA